MKRKLFAGLLMTSLLTVAGCGKDNSSGGNDGYPGYDHNPYTNISPVGADMLPYFLRSTYQGQNIINTFNQAVNWSKNSQERQVLGPGFTRGIVSLNMEEDPNCRSVDLWIINLRGCAYGGSNQPQVQFEGTPQQFCTDPVNGGLQIRTATSATVPYSMYGCDLTTAPITYNKANNVELAKVMSLNNRTWTLHNAIFMNGVYTIVVGPLNSAPSHTYTIDTNVHSVYNPVVITDLKTEKSIKSIAQ